MSRQQTFVTELRVKGHLLIHVTLVAFALRYITGFVEFAFLGIGTTVVYVALNKDSVQSLVSDWRWLTIAMLAMTMLSILSSQLYAWRPLYYAIIGWCTVLSAFEYVRGKASAIDGARLLLFGFVSTLAILAPFKGVAPDAFNHYFPSSSRNGISATLIFCQVFYSAAYFVKHGRAPAITPVLTFAICVALFGRSGIGLSAAIVAATVAQNLKTEPVRSISVALVTGSVLVIVVFFPLLPADLMGIAGSSTMSNGLGDRVDDPSLSEFRLGLYSIRNVILAEYFQRLTPQTILLGVPLQSVPWIAELNGNAHNSFLRGHAFFGIAYVLLIAGMGLAAALGAIRRKQFFVLMLMAVFVGRAFFDSFALFDVFDIGFFYCFFLLACRATRAKA